MLYSACTYHMTGEKEMFTSFEPNDNPHDAITFADNSQGKILGFGKIAISTEHSISNVYLVETLTYNLLSASQLLSLGFSIVASR